MAVLHVHILIMDTLMDILFHHTAAPEAAIPERPSPHLVRLHKAETPKADGAATQGPTEKTGAGESFDPQARGVGDNTNTAGEFDQERQHGCRGHWNRRGGMRGRRGGVHGGWRRGHWNGGESGFDVSALLQRIGSRVGLDLSDVARDVMVQLNNNDNEQIDFVPRADVFDLPSEYLVHVSLPGAQKPDISVDYDAEDNVLRLAGVVYRPQISEELQNALVADERRREVGVFQRNVKLGAHEKPARVEVDAITANLDNGVLVVRIPKAQEPEKLRKKVSIETIVDTSNRKGKEKETETIIDETLNKNQTLVDLDGDVNVENADTESVSKHHASVTDVPDESEDDMHLDSETEPGDASSHPNDGQFTPEDSDDEFVEGDMKEYVKVHVE